MKFRITAGTQVVEVEGNPMAEAERLHKLTGIRPSITTMDPVPVPDLPPIPRDPKFDLYHPERTPAPIKDGPIAPVPRGEGHVDTTGQIRSTLDAAQAADSGFALKQPLYTRGTRVNETGVENARTSRLEYEALPSAKVVHMELAQTVQAEGRKDIPVQASNLFLRTDGKLTTRGKESIGIDLSHRSFQQLIGRLDIPAGGAYLSHCPPTLRAVNVNHWVDTRLQEEQLPGATAKELQLRLRGPRGQREIFAITGPKYASYDADQIAEAVAMAAPQDARGTVAYDGYRAHGEVLFHSTVRPEHYVAGEIFRAGVSWSTDDTGGGSIVCRASVTANLCLNLIVIDKSEQDTVRLRHQGSVEKLAQGFRVGFQGALAKISHFVRAWDVACEDSIVDSAVVLDDSPVPTVREILIASAIRGMMEQDLVTVPGRRENVIAGVVAAWKMDDSGAGKSLDGVNRAALANALTRYAHESGKLDPWEQDVLQTQAGQLVYGAGRYARIPLLKEKA